MFLHLTSAACILATSFFYITEPVVDMRESPTEESKVVSQTVFSEKINIELEGDYWSYVITPEGYAGWIPTNTYIECKSPYEPTVKTSRLASRLYRKPDIEHGAIATLPYDSKLKVIDASDPRWLKVVLPNGKEAFLQRGDVAVVSVINTKGDLVGLSKRFLDLPYTWGGRSSFGYDSSGFTQLLYAHLGIDLPRDSNQQILDPRFRTIEMKDLEAGDLLFFGQSEQSIQHVGMYIGNDQFIHATILENQPWIRISQLSDFEWSGNPDAYYPYRLARQMIPQ